MPVIYNVLDIIPLKTTLTSKDQQCLAVDARESFWAIAESLGVARRHLLAATVAIHGALREGCAAGYRNQLIRARHFGWKRKKNDKIERGCQIGIGYGVYVNSVFK